MLEELTIHHHHYQFRSRLNSFNSGQRNYNRSCLIVQAYRMSPSPVQLEVRCVLGIKNPPPSVMSSCIFYLCICVIREQKVNCDITGFVREHKYNFVFLFSKDKAYQQFIKAITHSSTRGLQAKSQPICFLCFSFTPSCPFGYNIYMVFT